MTLQELIRAKASKDAEIQKMKQRLELMTEPGMEFYAYPSLVYRLRLAILQAEDERAELDEIRAEKEYVNPLNLESCQR